MTKQKKEISKRFPANTSLNVQTFLNDKSINSELYAYLQSISEVFKEGEQYITFVDKKKLPVQKEICKIIGVQSPKTYRTHLKNLISKGFVIEKDSIYELPPKEDIFFMIPLKTLQFLKDTATENVFKTYIYLGQRFKYARAQGRKYEFTMTELGEHMGVKIANYSRGYEMVRNTLIALENNGLIEYENFFDGKIMKKKLLNFSFQVKVNRQGR